MACSECPILLTICQNKVHIFIVNREVKTGIKEEKKKKGKKEPPHFYSQRSYGRNSSSSTLMTLAGMEGSGWSRTSEPNHLARPRGELPRCRWAPFVHWGLWPCDTGMLGCTEKTESGRKTVSENLWIRLYWNCGTELTWSLGLKLWGHYCQLHLSVGSGR